jgi:hypothetical protein
MDHHKSLTRRTQTLAAQMAFVCGICSASGFTQQAKTNGVDWKALATQMEKALGGRYSDCDENSRGIAVMNTADIGFPVALVSYCHMGAYTSDTTVFRLERGRPVPAVFRASGKVVHPEMLDGSSVMNGTGVELFQ